MRISSEGISTINHLFKAPTLFLESYLFCSASALHSQNIVLPDIFSRSIRQCRIEAKKKWFCPFAYLQGSHIPLMSSWSFLVLDSGQDWRKRCSRRRDNSLLLDPYIHIPDLLPILVNRCEDSVSLPSCTGFSTALSESSSSPPTKTSSRLALSRK